MAAAACAGVSLEIDDGEFVAIVGPSGSGKSTLLNLIGTLDRPSSGTVEIDGVDVGSLSDAKLSALRASRIGFVFQQFHLVNYLTALENVMLAQYYHSITDEKERALAKLRKDISEKARQQTEKIRKSRHFVPIFSAIVVVALFLFSIFLSL